MKRMLLVLSLFGCLFLSGQKSVVAAEYDNYEVQDVPVEKIEKIEDSNGNIYSDTASIINILYPKSNQIETRHNHEYIYHNTIYSHVRNTGKLCDVYYVNKYRCRCGRTANGVITFSYSHYER